MARRVPMNRLSAISSAIGFAVCLLFAALQWNDLDPEIYHRPSHVDAWGWLIFYAYIALLFALAVFRRPVSRWLLAAGFAFCLVQLARTAPGFLENLGDDAFAIGKESMSSGNPQVELSREFLGAAIALGGLCLLTWQQRSAMRSR